MNCGENKSADCKLCLFACFLFAVENFISRCNDSKAQEQPEFIHRGICCVYKLLTPAKLQTGSLAGAAEPHCLCTGIT